MMANCKDYFGNLFQEDNTQLRVSGWKTLRLSGPTTINSILYDANVSISEMAYLSLDLNGGIFFGPCEPFIPPSLNFVKCL